MCSLRKGALWFVRTLNEREKGEKGVQLPQSLPLDPTLSDKHSYLLP
jgi:hypothetical protein